MSLQMFRRAQDINGVLSFHLNSSDENQQISWFGTIDKKGKKEGKWKQGRAGGRKYNRYTEEVENKYIFAVTKSRMQLYTLNKNDRDG